MAGVLFRPLTPQWGMQRRWTDGRSMHDLAAEFIKPNDRLSSFERLEIYNRQYWFRVLDCLWDDYPGLRAIVGEQKFMKLITAYLARYPSDSYTLRDLGNRPGRAGMGRAAGGIGDRHGAFRMGTGGRLRWAIKGADQSRRYP